MSARVVSSRPRREHPTSAGAPRAGERVYSPSRDICGEVVDEPSFVADGVGLAGWEPAQGLGEPGLGGYVWVQPDPILAWVGDLVSDEED